MSLLNSINPLLIIHFTLISISVVSSTDYCSKSLCGGKKHIACGHNGKFGDQCPQDAVLVPMAEHQKFIVDKHNEIRKGVSSGHYKGLAKANRMVEMKWNPELADLAERTVKTCVYAHDQCRNTETYTKVGQSIAWYSTKAVAPVNYTTVCSGILDSWLRQAKNCGMELIEQFRSDVGSTKKVDDFTQMIRASCCQIGCAMSYFKQKGAKNVFFVCNYSSANEPKQPVYEIGPPCSACQAGCSFTSPGLCNTAEERYLLKLNLNLLNLIKLKLKL